ncbi:hypothetical protein [Nakamurella alba]|nr:hypothetical protein [Nakamurella alba]
MTLLLILALFVLIAVAAPLLGRDSRSIGDPKWGDGRSGPPLSRW